MSRATPQHATRHKQPPVTAQALTRLAGLDTLRAVAILWVILFHLQSQLPPGLEAVAQYGWMGVDLFFVLSGYLIGLQLVRSHREGRKPSLIGFYARRAFRILPAYLIVLLLYCAWPTWREQPGLSPAWQFLTFTLNYRIDYAQNQSFSHAWSLCVEEHFYLLLPLLLRTTMHRLSARGTAALFALFVAAGMLVRGLLLFHVVLPADDASPLRYLERIYYPTHTRLDSLLAGVALALTRILRPAWWARLTQRGTLTAATGCALLAGSLWLSHDRSAFATLIAQGNIIVGPPLLALAFALLTASAVSPGSALSRTRIPGARLLALLAFSLYLTHKEMAHLAHVYLPGLTQHRDLKAATIYAVSCLLGASALYLSVERPFLLLRERLTGSSPEATPGTSPATILRTDPAL